jgi:hypothetical protein
MKPAKKIQYLLMIGVFAIVSCGTDEFSTTGNNGSSSGEDMADAPGNVIDYPDNSNTNSDPSTENTMSSSTYSKPGHNNSTASQAYNDPVNPEPLSGGNHVSGGGTTANENTATSTNEDQSASSKPENNSSGNSHRRKSSGGGKNKSGSSGNTRSRPNGPDITAPPDGEDPQDVPIDGGLSLFIAAGIGAGIIKTYRAGRKHGSGREAENKNSC